MRTLDLSNHDFATFDPACLQAAGVTRVILGCWDFAIAETMLLALGRHGIVVEDLYCFLYYRLPWENNDVLNALALARRHGGIARVWLDCEAMFDGPSGHLDTEAEGTTVTQRVNITFRYFEELRVAGLEPGIYTGQFWWADKMGGTTLFARNGAKLWLANYGSNDPDNPRWAIETVSWGGWSKVSVHQYSSVIPVCGRGRDHNYWMLEDEVTRTEYEDLVLALFSGQEEKDKPRPERLVAALYRMDAIVNGAKEKDQVDRSVSQQVANIREQVKKLKLPEGPVTITGEIKYREAK